MSEPQISSITAVAVPLQGSDPALLIDFIYPDDEAMPNMEIRARVKTPVSDWAMRGTVILPYVVGANLWRMGSAMVARGQTLEVQIRRTATRGTKMEWSAIAEVTT